MQKDLVFFKKEGEEGVALTSTSANHIANLAKEYIQGVETQLNNVCFFNAEVSLVGSTGASIIQTGGTSEVFGRKLQGQDSTGTYGGDCSKCNIPQCKRVVGYY